VTTLRQDRRSLDECRVAGSQYSALRAPKPDAMRVFRTDLVDGKEQFTAALAVADAVGDRWAAFIRSPAWDTDGSELWDSFQRCYWPMVDGVGDPAQLQYGLALGWVTGLLEEERGWAVVAATHPLISNGICIARQQLLSCAEGSAEYFALEVGYYFSRTRLRPDGVRHSH